VGIAGTGTRAAAPHRFGVPARGAQPSAVRAVPGRLSVLLLKCPPEEMQQHMQKCHTWMNEGFQKGWMVNTGDGLKNEGRVVNGKKLVTEGPFVEAKEIVGGFTIVKAESLDAAAEIAKACPCLHAGGTVEVRPLEGYTK
jgi:hypothetical protein